jgi:hypothetical protein
LIFLMSFGVGEVSSSGIRVPGAIAVVDDNGCRVSI